MNVPPELYAIGLIKLMERENVHHFVVDRASLDPEKVIGLAINIWVEDDKLTFATGRCDCPECAAATSGTQ